ncbi:MAG: class II fructose-bisphosphate aldolase [Chloroflexi bacterium]|nr:class II fructose-bisphosphate aldolase [Chloroflexota bacterium]
MLRSAEIVLNAYRAGIVIPAFNIPYLPMMEPVIRAIVDQDSFAFIETARLEWFKFEAGGPDEVMAEFRKWNKPEYVRLHLDHVPVIDEDDIRIDYLPIIKHAIDLGYHSVMIDGSRLSLDENIAATRRVVELAHHAGIACEAELGAVLGHEAGPLPPYDELFETGRGFTRIDEAERFVNETGCDWLSVAVGSIHGAISGTQKDQKKVEARLNLDHLEQLREATQIPLVLHGGSGVRQSDVLAAFKKGIAKINIGSEIRQAYERTRLETGRVEAAQEAAQEAVYKRTTELIRDYLGNAGIRSTVAGETITPHDKGRAIP